MIKFHAPFSLLIAGSSGTGKTQIVYKLLQNQSDLFTTPPDKILYCYGQYQSLFDDIEKQCANVEFYEGLPSKDIIIAFASKYKSSLICIDDLMAECINSSDMQDVFTKYSHHLNMSVIFISQNLYIQGKYSRTISLNLHYIIATKSNRDISQISVLARQTGLRKTLQQAYSDATSIPFGYLLIDLSPWPIENEGQQLQLYTNIFPPNDLVVYTPI